MVQQAGGLTVATASSAAIMELSIWSIFAMKMLGRGARQSLHTLGLWVIGQASCRVQQSYRRAGGGSTTVSSAVVGAAAGSGGRVVMGCIATIVLL